MIEHRFPPLLARHLPAFQAVIRCNVNVVVLRERGIVTRQTAVGLVRVLSRLAQAGPRGLRFSAELEDVYPNVEAEVIRRLGEQMGGALLTGRSRAEVQLTADRLLLRETLQELAEDLIASARVLLGLASAHRESYMLTYTFLQPAQPSMFGHYLLSHVEAARSEAAAWKRPMTR
jgi:argininosuccinate lyase